MCRTTTTNESGTDDEGDDCAPIHPGEILLTEFLERLELSQTRLAHAMEVPPRQVNEIVLGKRAVTADTALRLSRAFGTRGLF